MDNILEVCTEFPEITLKPGEYLLEEGTKSGLLFILIEGEFEIVKEGFQINKVSEPGAIFGEISVLLDIPILLSTLLAQRLNGVTSYLFELKNQLGNDSIN